MGPAGRILGLNRYGESTPGTRVFKALGFTVEIVVKLVQELLAYRVNPELSV